MIAVDTNLLVYAHRVDSTDFEAASACLTQLAESPTPWAICFHSLVEFYGIVTRPKLWDKASTPKQAKEQIQAWRDSRSLVILTDNREDLDPLLNLALSAKLSGPIIHDARIANCCLSHGVSELWTKDRHFKRFPNLKTRNPLS